MSVVGKELDSLSEYDPASAGRNSSSSSSDSEGELSKLLKLKEEEGDGIIEKEKKDAAAGDYHNNNNNKNKKKDDVDEGGDIQMHKQKGFKVDTGEKFCDLMFRLIKEIDEEDQKKKAAGDYSHNNNGDDHDEGILLLKKGYEKLMMNNKEAKEGEGGGGIGIIGRNNKLKENIMIGEQQSAVVPIQLNDLDYLLASRCASAPTKMSRSMKKMNQAYANKFRKQFGPHRDNFSTANRMFSERTRSPCTSLPPN